MQWFTGQQNTSFHFELKFQYFAFALGKKNIVDSFEKQLTTD